jgi:hypothetical protein
MKYRIKQIIRVGLWLAVLALSFWLINKNFPASGRPVFKLDFTKNQAAISKLRPESRLALAGNYQIISGSPVYFNLRTIQLYPQARFEIIFQNRGRSLTGLAGKIGTGWNYEVKKPSAVLGLENNWQQAIFDFDLTRLYKIRNLMEFLVVSEGEADGKLIIKEIKVTLRQ